MTIHLHFNHTGQFWNVPVNITIYRGVVAGRNPADRRYIVSVSTNGGSRAYTGTIDPLTWDLSKGPCLYVGSRQSGPIFEVSDPNDPVIESVYTNYQVKQPFVEDQDYKFGRFEESRCTVFPTPTMN